MTGVSEAPIWALAFPDGPHIGRVSPYLTISQPVCLWEGPGVYAIWLTMLGALQLIVLIADLMKRQPSARPSAAEAYRWGHGPCSALAE